MLILDADQIPKPEILDHTLGWFQDDEVALVQTPQWFTNVTDSDPLGSQAPLFYGPIQQGKDGWNAAFFCGSNAVLRREALMQLGIVGYVREVESAVADALRTSSRLRPPPRSTPAPAARWPPPRSTRSRRPPRRPGRTSPPAPRCREVTYAFQQRADASGAAHRQRGPPRSGPTSRRSRVACRTCRSTTPAGELVVDDAALTRLAARDLSPLSAIESVRQSCTPSTSTAPTRPSR